MIRVVMCAGCAHEIKKYEAEGSAASYEQVFGLCHSCDQIDRKTTPHQIARDRVKDRKGNP